MIITVCMLISICSVSVVFADGDRIYGDPTYDYYKTIDTSSNAKDNYGLYMESLYTNLQYHSSAFVSDGGGNASFAAIAWPPVLRERVAGDGFPAQNATITKKGSDYIVMSKNSRVKYRMPARITPTAAQVNSGNSFDLNEVLIIDYKRSYNGGATRGMSGVIEIGKSYEKIHFLIGHASDSVGDLYGNGQIQAHVIYDDGTTTLPEEVRVANVAWASKYVYWFPGDMIDAPESDGRYGYICESLPLVTAKGQSNADNFVADFVSYVSPSNTQYNNVNYPGQFTTTSTKLTHAAYEYTLTLDPQKVVKQIVFSQTSGCGGYAVLGISGENDRPDWTDKVEEINTAIAELEENADNSSASDVVNTMELINSAIEAGVESYIDTETFNGLFSNEVFIGNLVDGMFADVDIENVTWDDTSEKFKDLDDVASIIEETGNFEGCPVKDDIVDAYTGMVDSLINEEEKDNDKMIERFELLKSAKTTAFQTIFDDKVIYNKTTPSISTTPEFVAYDIDFSKPVDEEMLVADNFEVLCGKDKIDDSWITIEPKLTGEDITGAIVKVLNSQDYSKSYTLNVSRDLKGKNNESWGYQLTKIDNASEPFSAKSKDIQFKESDRTFKGKITLSNSASSAVPCVILITSYDANGKCLGTIYAQPADGTIPKGSKDIDFTGMLPDGAKDVLCYVYDSVTRMTLLTPPVTIEIPAE